MTCLIEIEDSVVQVLHDIGDMSEFDVIDVGVDTNHVHLVVSSKPTLAPGDIARRLKQISVHRLWNTHHEHLAQFFWGKRRGSTVWTGDTFVNPVALFRKEPCLIM